MGLNVLSGSLESQRLPFRAEVSTPPAWDDRTQEECARDVLRSFDINDHIIQIMIYELKRDILKHTIKKPWQHLGTCRQPKRRTGILVQIPISTESYQGFWSLGHWYLVIRFDVGPRWWNTWPSQTNVTPNEHRAVALTQLRYVYSTTWSRQPHDCRPLVLTPRTGGSNS